jgi:hypothetical protein
LRASKSKKHFIARYEHKIVIANYSAFNIHWRNDEAIYFFPCSLAGVLQFFRINSAQAVADSYFCHSEPFGFAQDKLREESHFQSRTKILRSQAPSE